MQYISTRGGGAPVSAAQAIVAGLAPDGGLYMPEKLPRFTQADLEALRPLDYPTRAARVLAPFLTDFSEEELLACTKAAYAPVKFGGQNPAPVVRLDGQTYLLELFRGPTCAFKDFALQLLPHLMTRSLQKTGTDKKTAILTATSGDTGKAALEGFSDVEGTCICVFFPDGGASRIQQLQMTTQQGRNVLVLAARGNFDDAQRGVKKIFTDAALERRLADAGYLLSSANSINWGRLVPQIAYYVSAYCDMVGMGALQMGQAMDVAVPTGNFGNILAAYLAKLCGLPIGTLVCASNKNNVLTDFLSTGCYDRNRPFYKTESPSMDILVSSNLERLLYLCTERDFRRVQSYMQQLEQDGIYAVEPAVLAQIQTEFACGCADDAQGAAALDTLRKSCGYLCDPHTAIAVHVVRSRSTGTGNPMLIAATASPFKFASSVLPAAFGEQPQGSDFDQLRRLSALSGLPAPVALAGLEGTPERFTRVIEPAQMPEAVEQWLKS